MNPKPEKIQNTNPKHPVWDFLIFEHLDLFRISDFVLRIFVLGAFASLREASLSDSVMQNATENFKYVWLGFPAGFVGQRFERRPVKSVVDELFRFKVRSFL